MSTAIVRLYQFIDKSGYRLALSEPQVMMLGDIYLRHGKEVGALVRSKQVAENVRLWNSFRYLCPTLHAANDVIVSSIMWDVVEELVFIRAVHTARDPKLHQGWNDLMSSFSANIDKHPELYSDILSDNVTRMQ